MNPPAPTATLKRDLRQLARTRLSQVTPEQRQTESAAAVAQLLARLEFQRAQRILGYLALKDELDLSLALESPLRSGRTVALPRYIPDQNTYCAALIASPPATHHLPLPTHLAPGAFGILEPSASAATIPLNQLDFILVPGVAFDPSGRRLGRGKGFYDRLLAETNNACIKCGVALEEQLVAAIPSESHDIAMDFILTPSRWIICKEGACH